MSWSIGARQGLCEKGKCGQIWQFIQCHLDALGFAPTFREISEATKINSYGQIGHHLDRLQKAGIIKRESYKARSIVLMVRMDVSTTSEEDGTWDAIMQGVPFSSKR